MHDPPEMLALSIRQPYAERQGFGMVARYHAAMDWKDWCKLAGAIVFFVIALWRGISYLRARRQNSN